MDYLSQALANLIIGALWCGFFSVVSLTAANTPLFLSRKQNKRSQMDQNAFDLCRIAAIGKIFSSLGELSLMSSQLTMCTWPNRTFSATSSVKWVIAIASRESTNLCGPCATASHISSLDHGHPVHVGHPNVAHFVSRSAAGWDSTLPWGHMELQYCRPSGDSGGIVGLVIPLCIVHCE
jgi:hypothetical protein